MPVNAPGPFSLSDPNGRSFKYVVIPASTDVVSTDYSII